MDKTKLTSLYISPNAAEIYLTLVKSGELKAGEIIKLTGKQRSVVYKSLDELLAEKLIVKDTSRGVARFVPLPTTRLVERAQEQTRLARLAADELSLFSRVVAPTIAIQQGLPAMHKAFYSMLDELKPGEEYFTLGTNLGTYKEPLKSFFFEFNKRRVEKQVTANVLCYKGAHKTVYEAFQRAGDTTRAYSKVRILPVTPITPMQINLYHNKVMIIVQDEMMPSVMVFERQDMYDGFKAYFDAFWNISR